MTFLRGKIWIPRAAFAVLLLCALASLASAQPKTPVIIIPGLSGSELRNPQTKERIWFNALRPKSGRIQLPLQADPTVMHDDLVANDIVRSIKFGPVPYDVYGGFLKALTTRGGYHEENWDTPSVKGGDGAIYVFAYDWRLDNVGNARLLIRKIDDLRKRLGQPGLKFNIVAHSMGGFIARYAAMYGDTDLPPPGQKPRPTWVGERYFDHIVLMGTPNEGAMNAFVSFINGFSFKGWRIDLPIFQDSSKFMVFSIPTAYQMLPAPGTLRAFDDHLQPMALDLYDPATWRKYGWDIISDPNFVDHFSASDRRVAQTFFAAALDRARRLHEALAAADGEAKGIDIYPVGTDCRKETTDGVVLYLDDSGHWKTHFRPSGFTRADGTRVSDAAVRNVVVSPGDGVVPFHSLNASIESQHAGVASIFAGQPAENICEEHNTQATNSKIQDYVIKVLSGAVLARQARSTTVAP
ncbi:MAG: hypothetical protein JO314_01425 [Acidobacteria bacterium]|nr:hypothetical protein [Acidobacteriota bacterium]